MISPRVAPTQQTWTSALRGCASVCLVFFCLNAAGNSIQAKFPAEVAMNADAGRGGRIIVTFELGDGEELPLLVDTGSPWTLLDKSLEPKLGKRVGSITVGYVQSGSAKKLNKYAAPKLYLGTLLLTTSNSLVLTDEFTKQSPPGYPAGPLGILGLDILSRYRIQMDFEAGKLRFLGSDQLNKGDLGKAFPLAYSHGHAVIHHDGLIGSGTNFIIDTGCNIDGAVNKGGINGIAVILPQCVWDGATYTDLVVVAADHFNALGLSFLARHLVTFDFPNRTMYLKQTLSGPLVGNIFKEIGPEHRAPAEFLEDLKEKGRLPGVPKEEQVTIYYKDFSDLAFQPANAKTATYLRAARQETGKSVTFDFCKNGDPSVFHYQVIQRSNNDPWKLQKAWRTDENGHLIEQYPIPSA